MSAIGQHLRPIAEISFRSCDLSTWYFQKYIWNVSWFMTFFFRFLNIFMKLLAHWNMTFWIINLCSSCLEHMFQIWTYMSYLLFSYNNLFLKLVLYICFQNKLSLASYRRGLCSFVDSTRVVNDWGLSKTKQWLYAYLDKWWACVLSVAKEG